ncbi:MAG: deoxyribonuclease IV [Erysipelotrichaceae bacterium]|nr:deoxyribonuclease IV [Erysipelotrichaceae bacterium]
MDLIIGSHVSYKNDTQLLGSVKEAISYGANTFMFYTGAPQNTKRGMIQDEITFQAYQLMREHHMDLENIICHAPYIVNLCNDEKFDFSVSFLKQEIERCEQLGITKLVLHPGSSVGLERNHAISNIIKGLNIILDNNYNVIICLETMAGKGTEVGKSFEELKFIIDHVNNKSRIGVCLDTCHIHDAGYDLNDFDAVLDEFERVIGLSYLKCLHINDSKNEKESHKDRHENIGYGCIGFDNLIHIIYHKKLEKIPKILETPYIEKEYPPYKQEIDMILDKVFNEKLKEEVIDYYQR